MKTLPFLAIALLSLAFAPLASPQEPPVPTVRWHTDYETARTEANRSGKPLFVVFRCER
jgi:hypothetical protein